MEFSEIIDHCKSGNKVAQGVLFNAWYRPMYRLSMRILANHHDTEDALVLAFTRIFDNIARFEYRGEYSLNKWIRTIVIREAIRLVTSRNQLQYSEDMTAFDSPAPEEEEMENMDAEQIRTIIETMPAGYRLVFNLFALEGYSHKEIGGLLNISENTSKSQLRKARIYIIEKMKKPKHMDTQNIDAIVKNAMEASESYYDSQALEAQERIWNQVQQSRRRKIPVLFLSLAAACVLLLFVSSFLWFSLVRTKQSVTTQAALISQFNRKSILTEDSVRVTGTAQGEVMPKKDTVIVVKKVFVNQPVVSTITRTDTVYIEK
ncbi:MAG: sigma-70 family RNA polymerase sigma factor [Bacteroidetes bacterium]|nr:sigma-70 family RNA polymerase sigma factor [Bacteroidota bacterium]